MEYIDEDGEYNIHPKHLSNMLDLVKTKEDFDTVVEAYYNFKGHKTSFSNNTVDKLVVTAVRIGQPEKVFDIINHHHYLLYYPHIKTVNLVLNYLVSSQDSGMLHNYLGIIKNRKLIQLDQKFVDTLERKAYEYKHEGRNLNFISAVLENCKARIA